jgi:histidine triad (HIT) family protein
VYEDGDAIAFMDIGPIIKGHTLVIPRDHFSDLEATPEDVLAKLIRVVKHVARAQMNGLGAEGINVVQNNGRPAGQEVDHFHFHVIPRFAADGHRWNWNAKSYETNEEMARLAERIRQHLP